MMNNKIVRQVVNILALAGMITVNVLANALPINGQNSGEISDRFPVRFTPAGYVFSIWGLIYLVLTAFVIYQALPAQRENRLVNRIGWLFALSCVLNASWLFAWHYNQFPLSMLVMLGLLGSLIAIYARIRSVEPVERRDHWLVRVPFSIYLGWITVATVANACIVLYNAGWGGLGVSAEVWTVVLLVIGLAITAFISLRLGDAAYGLVILWAYIGIVVKQNDALLVAVAAGIGAAIAALLVAAAYFRSRPRLRRQTV
jgi:hypothetical protein